MSDHDDLARALGRELHDRVDTMAGSSLGLGDVQVRARSIRRRRAATAVVAVIAAVAVIAPTAAVAGHNLGHDHSLPPASQSVDPTPSPTATLPAPAPGVLDVSSLATGDAPHLEYVADGTVLHQVDGSTVDVGTRYPVTGFVSLRDGSHVWLTTHAGQPYVEVTEASGTVHDPVRSGWDLAVNAAHSDAAWVDPSGQVQVWDVGAGRQVPLGDPVTAGSDLRMGAVLGDACGSASSTCTVYVNVADATGPTSWQPWEVTGSGSQRLLDGSFLSVADETDAGLTIGLSKVSDFGSCSKLAGGGEFQGWSTCRHTLVSFSPGGSAVLGDPAYHDGLGNGSIAMYDAGTGRLLFQRHSDAGSQSHYPAAEWEDATHVLAPVFQDGRWAIVRISTDGSMEYAVAPAAGQAEQAPFTLPTGGMAAGD
jgi:hypothetical protein